MKKLFLIGFAVVTLNSFAQTKEGTVYSFSLQQAIDYAMQNQNNVKNAILDGELAQEKVHETRSFGLPQINSSFDTKDFLEIPTSVIPHAGGQFGGAPGSDAVLKFGSQYQASAGFDASQMIFNAQYFLGIKASKVYLDISSKSVQRTKIETSVIVSKAYYTVLVNEGRMKLLDANITRFKKILDDTKALLDNGFVEKIDYDRLTVTYNNLLVEQEKIKRLLDLGIYLLKYQMGMDINTSLTLTDKLEDVKLLDATNLASDKFDYTKRVEYNLFEGQFQMAKLDLKNQHFAYFPNAYAYGALSENAYRSTYSIFSTGYGWYPTALIGATVKMPIFTGLQRHAKTQQAKITIQKAENNLDFIKKSIDLELAAASTGLTNASVSLENQKKNIVIAEDVARVAKIKYEQGVGSNLEMITAEAALKEAQTNYFNALYDAIIAKIDFDKANGNLK